ncbi:MAG TPA: Uma2 family endonuclease [Actinomycetes bacterium]|nr:Uma2 family endonuclease [Actinomycetes bacterium]
MPVAPDLWPLDRPLTVDDLDVLQDDGLRYELWDGVLLVSPPPGLWHQELSHRVRAMVSRQLPSDWLARMEVGVGFGSRSRHLQPDGIVLRAAVLSPDLEYVSVEDIALVLEVESPSTGLYDRNTKRDWYAAVGIPIYVRVEINKMHVATVVVQELRDGRYVETGRTDAGTGSVTIRQPGPIVIDAAELMTIQEP